MVMEDRRQSSASQADAIREHALEHHVRPWRQSGDERLSIRAGDIVRSMGLRNATPNVCSALESRKFQHEAGLVLVERAGPRRSTTTTFHYVSGSGSPDPLTLPATRAATRAKHSEPRPVPRRHASPSRLPVADLCLVSCVSMKLPAPVPARDLYISPWFCKARALVEAIGWPWFILSAKYGLVDPDAVIEPYERTLKSMRANERREWARGVLEALDRPLQGVDSVVFFAGQAYRELLEPALCKRGIRVHVPMMGLGIGKQLSWLDQQVSTRR